jgi:hypothetical protein
VKKLVLFHHDPSHADERMDELFECARHTAGPDGPEVVAAYEGLRISL